MILEIYITNEPQLNARMTESNIPATMASSRDTPRMERKGCTFHFEIATIINATAAAKHNSSAIPDITVICYNMCFLNLEVISSSLSTPDSWKIR